MFLCLLLFNCSLTNNPYFAGRQYKDNTGFLSQPRAVAEGLQGPTAVMTRVGGRHPSLEKPGIAKGETLKKVITIA